ENLTLGHAIWVTEEDIDRLATRRASITSHPSCNLGMRNGLAPIYLMHRRGVNVAMGLDDKTINDDEDAIMELRMLHKLHRVPDYDLRTPALDAYDVLGMGTLNGARHRAQAAAPRRGAAQAEALRAGLVQRLAHAGRRDAVLCAEQPELTRAAQPLSRTMSQTTRRESGSRSAVGGNTFAMAPSRFARSFCNRRSVSLSDSPGKY